jgi:hypothetical protein
LSLSSSSSSSSSALAPSSDRAARLAAIDARVRALRLSGGHPGAAWLCAHEVPTCGDDSYGSVGGSVGCCCS